MVIWKWLELGRFSQKHPATVIRRARTDYNESKSFAVLARTRITFPMGECRLQVHSAHDTRHTLLCLPVSPREIHIWKITPIVVTPAGNGPAIDIPFLPQPCTDQSDDDAEGGSSDGGMIHKRARVSLIARSAVETGEQASGALVDTWVPTHHLALPYPHAGDDREGQDSEFGNRTYGLQCVAISPYGAE